MEYLTSIAWTTVFTVVLLVIYKYVINPQLVITVTDSMLNGCPDRWTFNSATKKCEPNYQTTCLPFPLDNPMLDNVAAKCNLARSCGTTWAGFCG